MNTEADPRESAISREEVRHVAMLARLELSDGDVDQYATILNRILGYFAKLNELDTDGVAPTSHPAPIKNVFREDEARPSLPVEEALANAPEVEADCFKVPQIIQES